MNHCVRLSAIADELQAIATSLSGGTTDRLDQYIGGHVHRVPGRDMPFTEFFSAFRRWLPTHEHVDWPKAAVVQRLADQIYTTGRADQPKRMLRGLSWTPQQPCDPEPPRPVNPAFDGGEMCMLARKLEREDGLTFTQIAKQWNDQGLRDEWNGYWSHDSVKQVWAD